MTILVAGTVEMAPGNRDAALADAAALMADTRSQKGCVHYVWAADPTSDKRIYVYEYWDSTEDLAAHLAGPFYGQMLGLLGKYGAENAQVSKFRIDLEEPVYDPEGNPRADFFTG
ncbi:MAG: antibiotic biosynthesis monooxygenase [Haliea sp.]|jgi:quinol monooxygenase YgiN|nr:antibiotic biosynthesis monooxygenase [Haliea sp.]